MATDLEDIIRYMRTEGGTEGIRGSYADQTRIVVSVADPGMSAKEINFAKAAFLAWADLIDIDFSFSDINPDITFQYTSDFDGDLAVATGRVSQFGDRRDVKINREAFPDDDELDFGSGAYEIFLHEIGHALGLTHPGDYNGEFPTYGEDNVYPEDYTQYTVMSYFGEGQFNYPTEYTEHSVTPMLHDVAAIQAIYGARTATRSGDTVYGFGSNNERMIGRFQFDFFDFDAVEIPNFTIWDGGGNDTIDSSGWTSGGIFGVEGTFPHFPNQIIDLRQGAFSSIGLEFVPLRPDIPLLNNISIAYGAVIENAIGSGGDDTIYGNDVDNRLVGNGGDDTIQGFDGEDTIEGGDGDDTVDGGDGDGDDTLVGGNGSDDLFGGNDDDTLIASAGLDRFFGGTGFDTVTYADTIYAQVDITVTDADGGPTFSSIENYVLTDGDDTFVGSDFAETISGNEGRDDIQGGGNDDTLNGGDGDDTLDGGDNEDTLSGGDDNDTLRGGRGADTLDGGTGADDMAGGDGNDTFYVDNVGDVVREFLPFNGSNPGTADLVVASIDYTLGIGVENLTLAGVLPRNGTGNLRANVITGNSAANVLDGGGDADTLIGRFGNDTYVVDNAGDVVDESGGRLTDIDTVRASISFSLANTVAVRGSVENLTLTGTAGISGTGNALRNTIIGNSGANTLSGGDNDDTLDGAGGADTLNGGTGNDTYIVDNAGDRVSEASGLAADIDTVQSSVTFDLRTVTGTVENLTLTGSAAINATGTNGANVLVGNSGGNTLAGAIGADTLDGGGGNDTLEGGRDSDTYLFSGAFGFDTVTDIGGTADKIVVSGAGLISAQRNANGDALLRFANGGAILVEGQFTTNTVETIQVGSQTLVFATGMTGGDASGIITGSDGADTLDGRGGDDVLYGNNGRDRLIGGWGNDRLDGGRGRDTLEGGAGDDILTGGSGFDTFVFAPSGVDGPAGNDTITDFRHILDRLDLRAFNTSWRALDDDRDLRLEAGEGDGNILVSRDDGDLLLSFAGGSVRVADTSVLTIVDVLL